MVVICFGDIVDRNCGIWNSSSMRQPLGKLESGLVQSNFRQILWIVNTTMKIRIRAWIITVLLMRLFQWQNYSFGYQRKNWEPWLLKKVFHGPASTLFSYMFFVKVVLSVNYTGISGNRFDSCYYEQLWTKITIITTNTFNLWDCDVGQVLDLHLKKMSARFLKVIWLCQEISRNERVSHVGSCAVDKLSGWNYPPCHVVLGLSSKNLARAVNFMGDRD